MRLQSLYLIAFCVVLFASPATAQLGGLGNKLKQVATNPETKNKLKKAVGNESAKSMAKQDSIDFQYAISINDNAGFFNINEKGEKFTSGTYMLTRDDEDKTEVEKARSNLNAAITAYEARYYKMAQEMLQTVQLSLESDENLKKEIVYLRCISSIGLVQLAQGRTFEAQQYIDQALEMSAKSLGTKSPAYIANMNNQAKLDQMNGKFNEAERAFDEAMDLVKTTLSDKSMQYAVVLNNKAMLYQSMGRYEEAIAIMKDAIRIADEAKSWFEGSKSFDSRKFSANLAFLYQVSGNYPDAENTYASIKKVFESRNQTNNVEYANLLNQIAILYIQMKKNDQVEALLKKSAEVYKKIVTEENPYYAKVVSDLGTFYRMTERYADAETNLQKALAIRERTLGTSHPDYAKTKEELAILYWKTNALDKAYDHYKPVMEKTIDFINGYFPPMSESEKTKYWDITFPRFQRFYNFAIAAAASKPAIVEDIYDYQTATKGLLLNSTSKIKQSILQSGDPALIKDYLMWLDKKELLSRYYALSKEELTEQKIDLAALENEANAMERSLSSKSSAFSSGYATQKTSFKQIRDVLADNEAVVEMIRVGTYAQEFTDESKYIMLILSKGMTQPKMVVLDNGNQLETRYAKYYRNAIQQKLKDDYSYDQYWARIDASLQGKKSIYISPDGVFNQVNLNTLKKTDGDFVINRYDLSIVGNSKDIIALKKNKAKATQKTAMLLGFPDYGGTSIAALPGTKTELENISKILKAGGYQVTQYVEKQASERNLKNVKGPALMHIATHGYFLKDTNGQGSAFGINAENAANNPLLRSGLMLANASKTVTGNTEANIESNDNGVLTAYEAMNLSLENTSLIVLSACETGLGDVKNGEGVYGLQRAFLVAGAEALVMSLWKVDDAATQQLMTNFYTNWTKLGNKQKAFKQAQLQLMTKYKEPYFWGAFVMMGQ